MRKTLKQITDRLLENEVDMTTTVAFVDEEAQSHEFALWDSQTWYTTMRQMFGKRVFDDWDDETDDIDEFCNTVLTTFDVWHDTRQDTYARRLYALSQDFKPLENYNSTETREGSFTHGESVTLSFENRKDTHKDDSFVEKSFNNYEEKEQDDTSTTRTYTNYQETYGNAQQTHTHNVSADDSANFVPRSQDIDGTHDDTKSIAGSFKDQKGFTVGDKKTISGSIKDQHGFTTNGVTDEKAGSETTAHSGKDEDEYTITRFGNIGVTTSQQMLASDLDLLRYDIVMQALKEWVHQYTFISEEVD